MFHVRTRVYFNLIKHVDTGLYAKPINNVESKGESPVLVLQRLNELDFFSDLVDLKQSEIK